MSALEIERGALDRLAASCPHVADRLHDEAAAVAVRRLTDASERAADFLDRAPEETSREALVRLSAAIGEWSVPVPGRRAV